MANWRKALEKGTVLFFDEENDVWLSNAPVTFVSYDVDIDDNVVFELERIKATPKKLARALEDFEAAAEHAESEYEIDNSEKV